MRDRFRIPVIDSQPFILGGVLIIAALGINARWPLSLIGMACFILAIMFILLISGRMDLGEATADFRIAWPRQAGQSRPWFESFAYAALLGTIFGISFRAVYNARIIPVLSSFAFVAPLIGIAEEFVYRGWIQKRLRNRFGPWGAIFLAVLFHAVYKCSLFLLPMSPGISLIKLGIWTAVVGLVMGWMTEATESVLPACLLHALFDLMAYGDLSSAPWWVW